METDDNLLGQSNMIRRVGLYRYNHTEIYFLADKNNELRLSKYLQNVK